MMTDAELLAAYVNNHDQDAFRILIERHAGLVYAAAIRQVRDPGMAQDVLQGVFMALASKAPGLQTKAASLPGWLLIAARYGARNLIRSRTARVHYEQEAAAMKNPLTSAVDSEKLFSLLDEALSRLSSVDRTAVALYYFENRGMRDVSNALAVSEGAAQIRVTRALARLRAILVRAGIACPADAFEESLHRNGAMVPPAALLTAVADSVLHPVTATSGGSVVAKGILKSLLIKKVAALTLTAAVAGVVVALPTVPLAYRALADSPQVMAAPPASTTAVANAPDTPTASPFTVTLPNGISIELLGVIDLSQNCWTPDGRVTQNLPQIWSGESMSGMFPPGGIAPKQRGLIWSARYALPSADIGIEAHITPEDANMGYGGVGDNDVLYSEAAVISKDQTTGTIRFDVATSHLQTAIASDGKKTVTTHQAGIGDFVLNPATSDGKDLVVTLLTNIHGKFQARFVAVDKNGMPMTANETSSQATNGQMNEITARFYNMSLNQIQQIRYEMRPYDLFVEFQNVSLVPGKHTNVQIEYGNSIN